MDVIGFTQIIGGRQTFLPDAAGLCVAIVLLFEYELDARLSLGHHIMGT